MVQRVNRSERERIPQFFALLSKGTPFNRANQIIKEQTGRGLRGEIAGRLFRRFRSERERTVAALPTLRSQRLKASMAQQVPFKSPSPINNRYLMDFKFQARNPNTGEIIEVTNTLGFRRLDRMGVFQDKMKDRIRDLLSRGEQYDIGDFVEFIEGSEQITGLFRTLNP